MRFRFLFSSLVRAEHFNALWNASGGENCNNTCQQTLSSVLIVLPGEFMQLGSKENENERFKHYLEKTFKKTASLIANSCKAVCTFHLRTFCHRAGEKPRFLRSGVFCWLCRPSLFKVSILVNADPEVHEIAFQYGKNVGIAFQVISETKAALKKNDESSNGRTSRYIWFVSKT